MQSSKIESGVQLFSRVTHKTFLAGINPNFFPEGGPLPNQVVEITGNPQTDKNDLLIDFIVKCILPNKYNNEWKGSAAILINTEFQINLFKIIKVIETLIRNNGITDSRKDIIENSLKHLTIFNCYSSEELEMTFYNLDKLIHGNENINLVVLDNIAAQFWITKFDNNMLSYYHHSIKNFEILYNAIKNLQVLLIFVRHKKISDNKKFSQKIDFRIEIEKDDDFKAFVTNYENQATTCVSFKLNTVLEFEL
ncbi:hypothetical protein NQ314_013416 [Rhamnusium bicolor]|uniref:DNA recombination and repair protein Rad51-like C-terminal domain-containing protein n=1 Tax=Rhamnusium bicolor TaxID=1586634 RepID=A0AAV8X754_9CUCU|nr:hypothetical protein NQ314_013416 [Rhamnusium bicolor]